MRNFIQLFFFLTQLYLADGSNFSEKRKEKRPLKIMNR